AAVAGTDERLAAGGKATFTYRTALRLALAGARDSVFLTNPYFTSPWVANEIAATARRFRREGRDPSRIVLLLTKAADETLASSFLTNHYVHKLKQLGVTVLEFAPDAADGDYIDGAINHAKAWVVDGRVAYLGSANLTVRSMTQDWEMGVVSDDPGFVGEVQRRLLDTDRGRSRPAKSLWAPWRYLGYGLSLFFGPLLRAT
ncbi:MAG TPA: phospholipase D family protein, partial [Kofleriaceae bacterium]|nr:phospholipase D family protein [Kofleriaceae bacterium]